MKMLSLGSLLLALTSFANPAIDAGRADIRALMTAQGAPGMSVAVIVDGRMVWSEGFGLADVEQNVAASGATLYRLGSVSKLFTAAIAARLAERGALDLDASVQTYAPFPHAVTARQLLGHLGGVRHYRDTDPIFAGKTYASLRDGLAIFASDPLVAPPGTAYTYSATATTSSASPSKARANARSRRRWTTKCCGRSR